MVTGRGAGSGPSKTILAHFNTSNLLKEGLESFPHTTLYCCILLYCNIFWQYNKKKRQMNTYHLQWFSAFKIIPHRDFMSVMEFRQYFSHHFSFYLVVGKSDRSITTKPFFSTTANIVVAEAETGCGIITPIPREENRAVIVWGSFTLFIRLIRVTTKNSSTFPSVSLQSVFPFLLQYAGGNEGVYWLSG